jgi:NitT/TauT family transport system substrate-binding protein
MIMSNSRIAVYCLCLAVLTWFAPECAFGDSLRLAIQKTGTVAWELDVMRAHGLDQQGGFTVKTLELASPEAGKIALRGGAADVIIADWLWVSRERGLGAKLVFYPYSSALGAVMVPENSSIGSLGDLKDKRLAVAGGPIDKSWLLLQAAAKQKGIDLKAQAKVIYGAPALLAGKMQQADADAMLNYWNFCARLEAKGFRRVVGINELLPTFGVSGNLSMLGYVFNESWAAAHRETVARFLEASRKAKQILLTSDAEWRRIAPLTGATDAATLKVYRVFFAFTLAMVAGTAIGLMMGRVKLADRLGDPWLIVLLNLPALVIIVLAFIWGGLTEIAAVLAVAINKLPNTFVTVREGARALDPGLDEMAQVFALPRLKALRHVILPQLAPYIAAAGRTGLSLVWKIVLIVELLGRPNGVGFEIGIAFQLFDVTLILAYALTFVVVILAIETLLVQPIERRASRWRIRAS